jgi:hypothetical protein
LKLGVITSHDLPDLVHQVAETVPNYYISPESIADTLERLGKPAAAEKLPVKLPGANQGVFNEKDAYPPLHVLALR